MLDIAETHFVTPFGEFSLQRYPLRKRETLRAWDAADGYLLDYLSEVDSLGGSILVVNDNFGGLTLPLASYRPTLLTDSFISRWSVEENLKQNGLTTNEVVITPLTDALDKEYDWVLIRIPKSLSLLEDELIRLKPHLNRSARVIGFSMTKMIHTSTLDLFSRIIGTTRTSLAKRKARLIFAEIDLSLKIPAFTYPTWYHLAEYGVDVCNHASLFSRQHVDIGTRLLLETLPESDDALEISDLGCGSGVIGVVAALKNPSARISFHDESYMAVASAEATASAAGISARCTFFVGDGLRGIASASLDRIFCNPPFHQQQSMGDSTAWRMFQQSRQALRRDGELWIVGNRHLDYHVKLKRLFGNAELVRSNRKFVVLRCRK